MDFSIGQIFVGSYPEEVAIWCNEGGVAHIVETTPVGCDVREFTIVANPPAPEMRSVRTFSKFSIWVATRELPVSEGAETTVWQAFESFLHDQGLWSGWSQLLDLVEDNPFFQEFYPKAVDVFGKNLVDDILQQSVISVKQVVL